MLACPPARLTLVPLLVAALTLSLHATASAEVLPGPGGFGVSQVSSIDINADGIDDVQISNALPAGWCQALGQNALFFQTIEGPMLPAGVTLGPTSPPTSFFSSFGMWEIVCPQFNCQLLCQACGNYYVGVVFDAADGKHAAWLHLSVTQIGQTSASVNVLESAWQSTPNAAITTGGEDCNGNGVMDELELEAIPSLDCNGNGVLDTCEPGALPVGQHGLRFHGGDDRVVVPSGAGAIPADEVTIELWIRPDVVKESVAFYAETGNEAQRCLAHIPWADGFVYFDFGDWAGQGRLAYLPPEPIIGSWQHFAFVASASANQMRIYRNGVLEASKSGMTPFAPGSVQDFLLGGIIGYGSAGEIDELHLWTKARSSAEIAADMISVDPSSVGLVLSFRLEEGAGSVTTDAASGLTGQVMGTTSWLDAFTCSGNPADLNGDDAVDGADLAILLGAWGPIPVGLGSPADFDGNNVIDAADLAVLLGAFGS